MDNFISEAIIKYNDLYKMKFHTPGHMGLLNAHDITEIGENGKYFPADLLTRASEVAADFYKCKNARFLVGGSSMGIKAAIMSVGGDILAAANSHQSVFEGAALARVKAITIPNERRNDLDLPITAAQIEGAIKLNPQISAVVITSPDYYGQCADVLQVYNVVKKCGKILIADSAHGAHFAGNRKLFPIGFESVADFCNMSGHKTMRALTQGAYLCVNNEKLLNAADENLKLLGTTSPSYLIYESLLGAIINISENGDYYDKLYEYIANFKKVVPTLDNSDFTRLVIDGKDFGGGKKLYEKLFAAGISCEKFDDRYVVLIVTLAHKTQAFEKLKEVILNAR